MIFITGCVRPNNVKFARMVVVLLLVATWSSTSTTVNAEDSDDVALVGFDFENGFSTNHTTVITGSVEDEVKPSSVTWSIEGDSELDSGDLSNILEEAASSGSRPIWTWSLELDRSEEHTSELQSQ